MGRLPETEWSNMNESPDLLKVNGAYQGRVVFPAINKPYPVGTEYEAVLAELAEVYPQNIYFVVEA